MPPTFGFVYVFNSRGYFEEAEQSYDSLRKHMPKINVAYVTHPELVIQKRDDVIWVPFEQQYDAPIVKTEAYRAPFDYCIFVDGDTRIVRDCRDVFRLLDRFDFALAHEPTRGWDYPTSAPRPFCELNTGVLAFRKNPSTSAFFEKWRAIYARMREEHALLNDQPSFREALWSSPEISHATLPSEYHLVTGKANSIAWDAHILHGRNDLEAVERDLARVSGPRAYTPDLGIIEPISGRRSALSAIKRLLPRLLKKALRPPVSASRQAPGDWEKRAGEARRRLPQ